MQGMTLPTHSWDLSPRDGIALQRKLAGSVRETVLTGRVTTVAGVDVGLKGDMAVAAVLMLTYPGLEAISSAVACRRITFPYIPGLLSFREGPVVMDAIGKLSRKPDLFIFDGQGHAHPRRLGIACHIGVLTGIPAIGCAKSRLCGTYQMPGTDKGCRSPLMDDGNVIGTVLRTRSGVKPVFVSVGHLIDLNGCIEFVLACCTKYRLPEPTRLAHHLAAREKGRIGS